MLIRSSSASSGMRLENFSMLQRMEEICAIKGSRSGSSISDTLRDPQEMF